MRAWQVAKQLVRNTIVSFYLSQRFFFLLSPQFTRSELNQFIHATKPQLAKPVSWFCPDKYADFKFEFKQLHEHLKKLNIDWMSPEDEVMLQILWELRKMLSLQSDRKPEQLMSIFVLYHSHRSPAVFS